jgi:hypothetical protein
MSKKVKHSVVKSQKKALLLQVEAKLTESLIEFPKKLNDKKFKKVVRKAGKMITKSLVTKPVKETALKSDLKKSKKEVQEVKAAIS